MAQTIFFTIYIFVAGRWDLISFYSRYVILILASSSILYILIQPVFYGSNEVSYSSVSEILISAIIALLFMVFMLRAIIGRKLKKEYILCDFPLKNGIYYVAHGGSSKLINHHYLKGAQSFALDILKINRFGFRCRGIYPKFLDRYYIYNEKVYSPIDGKIVKVVDGFDDLIPPERDATNKAGNHIVINMRGNTYILVAHLMKNSINVREGQIVSKGQFIGRIGNSGNTSEPHLHIHCVETNDDEYISNGIGIPILFEGKFYTRNTLMKNV